MKAKTVIHDACVKSLGDGANVPRIISRKGNNRRKMDADDILRFVALFDENLDEVPVIFVSRNLRRVLQINPGAVDLCFLSETVEDLRRNMEDLNEIKVQIVNLHNRVGGLVSSAKSNIPQQGMQFRNQGSLRQSRNASGMNLKPQSVGMTNDASFRVNISQTSAANTTLSSTTPRNSARRQYWRSIFVCSSSAETSCRRLKSV